MKAKNKTVATTISVKDAIADLPKDQQEVAEQLVKIFEKASKKKCVMWGKIFGFGEYHYVYESGREGDFLAVGFAMRKTGPVLYGILPADPSDPALEQLGKCKVSGSCIHIKQMDTVNMKVLEKLIKDGLARIHAQWGVQ